MLIATSVRMRMHMGRSIMFVYVTVGEPVAALALEAEPIRDAGGRAQQHGNSQEDEYDRNRELHRHSEPHRYRQLEQDDGAPDDKHRPRMAQSPRDPDACSRPDAPLATHDRGYRDHMVGIGRMPHSKDQSQQSDP